MAAEVTQHVAVLFEFPTLNGGEHSMLSVLRQLSVQSGVQFTAIAPPQGPLADQLTSIDVPVVPLTVRSSKGVKRDVSDLAIELGAVIAQLKPDVLHANSLSMSRLLGQVRSQLNVDGCTGHVRDIMKLSSKAVSDLNQLDRIAAVSQATKDYHRDQGLSSDRVQVIYNGVDTERFRHRPRAAARAAVLPDVPESARVLLNVGQICLRKGQQDLAHAVIKLLEENSDVHLVLLGERHSEKAESVAYEQSITQAFAAAGFEDRLHCPGYSRHVEQWMNAADLLVHTAHQEPLGRVLLEAAACELPVIATAVGGTAEILQDQHSACLIPPGVVDVLTDSIQAALRNPSLAATRASRACRRIRQRYTVEEACASLQSFWHAPTTGECL